MASTNKKFIIIDGHALLHRAWHALPMLTSPTGMVVNAFYGFASVLFKVLREMKPDYIAVAWDRKEPTWRHEAFKPYKAQREKQPEELYKQIDPIKELLKILGIPAYDLAGYEADDVIGTLAKETQKHRNTETIILTGDLDTLQLVDDKTKVLTLRKGITDTVLYDEKAVAERYGLRPEQLIDFKALRGDPSDNIPGVKGIGEKGASALLQEFGNIERIYKHLDEGCAEAQKQESTEAEKSASPPRFAWRGRGGGSRQAGQESTEARKQENKKAQKQESTEAKEGYCKIKSGLVKILQDGREAAFMSKKLVTLVRDLKFNFDLDEAKIKPLNLARLTEFLAEFGFKSLAERLAKAGSRTIRPSGIGAGAAREEKKQAGLFEAKPEAASQRPEFTTIKIKKELKDLTSRIKEVGRASFKILTDSQDIFNSKVLGIALATEAKNLYFVELDPEEAKEIFTDSKILKIGHDLKREYKILENAGLKLANPIFDCLIAAYVLNPGSRTHDLGSLALRHFNEVLPPEDADPKELALNHARLSFLLAAKLEGEIKNQNFSKLVYDIEFALIPVLARMELAGVLIDSEFLGEMSDNLSRRLGALAHKIHKLAGTEFNISSPQQLADILYNRLKIAPKIGRVRRGKTGLSTAASELEKLRGAHPIINLLSEHRELSKLQSTYVEALPRLVNSKTGRVHTSFNQAVTATGRLSSSEPNLQNIPIRTEVGARIRKAFIAPPGFSLLSADYSQFELRIAASLANDKNMIEAFRSGADIHTATAAEVWGTSPEKVTSEMRRAAKAINFGITYGMGYVGLAESADISAADAKKFIAKYFGIYSGLKNYIDETKALARSLGYVETIFGRRRYLPEIASEIPEVRAGAERMAINMPIQGSQADLIKIAMIRLDEALPKINSKAKMILQVHDELVFEAPSKDVKRIGQAAKNIMENVYKLKVPIVVDLKMGKNWGEMTAPRS